MTANQIRTELLEHSKPTNTFIQCANHFILYLMLILLWTNLRFSGYMPPEYAVDGLFSVKSDVFSFGVLVLEIVSGEKNRGFIHRDHRHNLLGHVSFSFSIYIEKSVTLGISTTDMHQYHMA